MKYLYSLIIYFLIIINIFSQSNQQTNKFSIDSLRNLSIPQQKLVITSNLGNKGKYQSYTVSYQVEDLTLYALLNIPLKASAINKLPVIVVNHGYIPPNQYSTINSYRLVSSYFANQGFIVLKPDYRGHDRSQTNRDLPLIERLHYPIDVLYLLNAVDSIIEADANHLFMYGHSIGGDITLKVLEATDKIK
ncbi:MAG: alpha/beta hydrolase, partial [Spirochaetes bacterium]|nr:alpha/beta hydrolase [Spirochaetota bacterium]